MKKFILTGLFVASLFATTLLSCSTDENSVSTSGEVTQKDGDPIIKGGSIWVKLGLGRTSLGCERIGICKVKEVGGNVNVGGVDVSIDKAIKQIRAVANPKTTKSGRDTSIRFEFADMDTYAWAKEFFSGEAIIMEEDTKLDMTELNKLGMDVVENFTVAAGEYPMTYNPETESYGFTFVSITE